MRSAPVFDTAPVIDHAARTRVLFLQFLQRLGRKPHAPTLVLVTHHVEEIVPAISHALILKSGRVLAAGGKRSVLTTANLSSAFGVPVKLSTKAGLYSLVVKGSSRHVI